MTSIKKTNDISQVHASLPHLQVRDCVNSLYREFSLFTLCEC